VQGGEAGVVSPGRLPGRGVRAVAVLAIGAAAVIAVAVVMSGRPAPGGHPASPAGQSGTSRAPAGPAAVSLAATHVSPAVTPVNMALHGTLAAATGSASLKYGGTYLWDIAARKFTATLPIPRGLDVTTLAFSPDGKALALVTGERVATPTATRRTCGTPPGRSSRPSPTRPGASAGVARSSRSGSAPAAPP
jgi:hypothetical protein